MKRSKVASNGELIKHTHGDHRYQKVLGKDKQPVRGLWMHNNVFSLNTADGLSIGSVFLHRVVLAE
jgi:hypothetical protein